MMDIIINLEDTYEPIEIESDFTEMTFSSPQTGAQDELILIKIDPLNNPNLPNVYNLGFGPPDRNGGFIDNVRLKHTDLNKVFSTVLFLGLTFLKENPTLTIGVDGSDDLRATLYHMIYKTNRAYLSEFFIPIGVDYYVRIFRDGTYEGESSGGYIAKPRPEPFDFKRTRHDLYRYYMFQLK